MNQPTTGELLEAMLDFRDAVGMRFDKVDKRFERIEADLGEVKSELGDVKADLGEVKFYVTSMDRRLGRLETRIENVERH